MRLPDVLKSTGYRLALVAAAIVLVCVVALGAGTYVTLKAAFMNQVRSTIEREMAEIVPAVDRMAPEIAARAVSSRAAMHTHRRFAYELSTADGVHLSGDRWLATQHVGWQEVELSNTAAKEVSMGGDFLVLTRRLESGLIVSVGADIQWIDEVEDTLLTQFAWALAGGLMLALVAGALISNTMLRRVDSVTRTAEAIIAGDLSRRVETTGSGDDFDRLAMTLNTMLNKIEGLMENLRQVTNDIAHDLRTPLSRLRQGLESARERGEGGDAIDRAISEANGLLVTFSALLRIAQVEAGARKAAFRPVSLSDVMLTVAEAYQPAAEDGGRSLNTEIADADFVMGDRELLSQMFSNLVENALSHSPPGTHVRMALEHQVTGGLVATVSDGGPGIPDTERAKVLLRFYRLDRSRTTEGNGLGLTLVAAVAELHGAALSLEDNRPGLRVMLAFQTSLLAPDLLETHQ